MPPTQEMKVARGFACNVMTIESGNRVRIRARTLSNEKQEPKTHRFT